MKKFITDIRTLAALLIASATFVACSSDNDIISENQQPANGKYTMTINASKGDGTTTRALTIDDSGVKNVLNATWATTENVYVQKAGAWATGSLQPQEAGTTTTLKGTLTIDGGIAANDVLTLQFPRSGAISYAGQLGTLADIAEKYDYATASVTVASISASGNINPKAATTTFTNQQAIIKFTLKDKGNSDAAISPTALTVTDGTSTVELTSIPAATYTANGADNVLYVAFPAAGSAKTVTLTATVGDDTYTYEKSSVTFTNGQYYEITVKMTKHVSLIVNPAVGQVIGNDGKNYADAAAATSAGATAVAKIVYVGSDNGESAPYNHGLALALSDANGSQCKWKTSQTDAGHTYQETSTFTEESGLQYNDATHNSDTYPAFKAAIANNSTAAPTGCSAWFLASGYQWQKMIAGDPGGLKTLAGLKLGYYWSSTERASGSAWQYNFAESKWYVDKKDAGYVWVRACLAF